MPAEDFIMSATHNLTGTYACVPGNTQEGSKGLLKADYLGFYMVHKKGMSNSELLLPLIDVHQLLKDITELVYQHAYLSTPTHMQLSGAHKRTRTLRSLQTGGTPTRQLTSRSHFLAMASSAIRAKAWLWSATMTPHHLCKPPLNGVCLVWCLALRLPVCAFQ